MSILKKISGFYRHYKAEQRACYLLSEAIHSEDKTQSEKLCGRAMRLDKRYCFTSREFLELVNDCDRKNLTTLVIS